MLAVVRWLLKPLATPLFFVGFLFVRLGLRFKKSAGATVGFMTGAAFIVLALIVDGKAPPGRRPWKGFMEREIELELEEEELS